MGVVYRAFDRLTGTSIALKSIALPAPLPAAAAAAAAATAAAAEAGPIAGSLALGETMAAPCIGPDTAPRHTQAAPHAVPVPEHLRLSLAQEFRTLASLRHPHIVSVLDYGFDQEQRPYFTMELLDRAQTLLDAARTSGFTTQVSLLIQILQALSYLHRRGVLHRDVKPANVLISTATGEPQAKLLDFGLAMLRPQSDSRAGLLAGTLGYLAPEVLLGELPMESADLYAVGAVAFEAFSGLPMYAQTEPAELVAAALSNEPDWSLLPASVRGVVRKLLARSPSERYPTAEAAIRALAAAGGVPQPEESSALRESFLQAAEFVGRDREFTELRGALQQALRQKGSAWLVGGESGVGKSRLVDELRTLALVSGVRVLRAQAQRDGGGGLRMFGEALRALSLEVELTELEASVLKSLVPDLPELLDREVPDAAALDAQATRLRLLGTASDILLRSAHPHLFLIEDLQWASADSLELVRRIAPELPTRPLFVVGTYRSDERQELGVEIPSAQKMTLQRLGKDAIAALCSSMLGPSLSAASLVDWLWEQTEGNSYFLVEVVRALAEEAGSLAAVTAVPLPQRMLTGGIEAILKRRLDRVPAAARRLLDLAAIAGRQIDVETLRVLDSRVEEWLHTCADAAVLEVSEQQWRFSHDKLRERLLADLEPAQNRRLHHEVAEAIEQAHPGNAEAARLAFHYEQAAVFDRAARHAAQAGEQALRRGTLAEAVTLLLQAQQLLRRVEATQIERVRVQRMLVSALFGLGRMAACVPAFQEAMRLLGEPAAQGPLAMGLALLRPTGWQLLHRLHPRFIKRPASAEQEALLLERTELHTLGLELYVYLTQPLGVAYSVLDGLNAAERHGDLAARSIALVGLGYLLSITPLRRLSRYYLDQGHALIAGKLAPRAELYALRGAAPASLNLGEPWRAAERVQRSLDLSVESGDIYAQLFSLFVGGLAYKILGNYHQAAQVATRAVQMSRAARNDYMLGLALGVCGAVALRRGRLAEAQELLDEGSRLAVAGKYALIQVYAGNAAALCALRRGDYEQARRAAREALELAASTPLTTNHCLDGYPAVADIFLTLWERATDRQERDHYHRQLQRALAVLRRYASAFPIGVPGLELLTGRYLWLQGEHAMARRHFERAIRAAESMKMAHEYALARAWLGRTLPSADRRAALTRALADLTRLDAAWDTAQVSRWLSENPRSAG